ncbi:MAG: acylphosphatase [Candidatus Cryosericum sp.]
MKRLVADVIGIVQGVGFRSFVYRAAAQLGISVLADNMDDGSVHVVASGDEQQLTCLLTLLRQGSRASSVDRVDYDLTDIDDRPEGS